MSGFSRWGYGLRSLFDLFRSLLHSNNLMSDNTPHFPVFEAPGTLKAHKTLKAHTLPAAVPRKRPGGAISGAAGGYSQAGYSPPVCCNINW